MSRASAYNKLQVTAASPEVIHRRSVESGIARMLAARCPPTDSQIVALLDRDAIPIALEVLKPGGLSAIIGRTMQFLLPYRVAAHFGVFARSGNETITLQDLRREKTSAARMARAALADISWRSASLEERRILTVRRLLLARQST